MEKTDHEIIDLVDYELKKSPEQFVVPQVKIKLQAQHTVKLDKRAGPSGRVDESSNDAEAIANFRGQSTVCQERETNLRPMTQLLTIDPRKRRQISSISQAERDKLINGEQLPSLDNTVLRNSWNMPQKAAGSVEDGEDKQDVVEDIELFK